MSRIRAIAQGQSLKFSFTLPKDENGEAVRTTGFICLMEVKQFPEQEAFISRIIPESADAFSWEGELTSTETAALGSSSKSPYYTLAKITNVSTDEQFEISDALHRFHVTETFFTQEIIMAGDFIGPPSSVPDNIVTFADETGKLGKDSGVPVAAIGLKADDNTVVKLSGDQSIDGIKTFNSSPVVPTPTTDFQSATKKYVDDNSGGGGGITLGTEQAASGTEIDFIDIPAGTKQITIIFNKVGFSGIGSSNILVQLGDSGGFENTGYISASAQIGVVGNDLDSDTVGFVVNVSSTTRLFSGQMILTIINPSSNHWVSSHTGMLSNGITGMGGGDKTLSGDLTQIRITRSGPDSFDNGTINIQFQGGTEEMNFFAKQLFHIEERENTGVPPTPNGLTAGVESTRELNFVVTNDIAGALLSGSLLQLPAGKYYCEASAPGHELDGHRIRLRDTTGDVDLIVGENGFAGVGNGSDVDHAILSGQFTLTVQSLLALQQRSTTTNLVDGFGIPNSIPPREVYSVIKIWRID